MNENDPYQSWVGKRRGVVFHDAFSKKVVEQILRNDQVARQPKPKWGIGRWIESIPMRPGMQAAMLAIALLAGALRLILVLQIVLSF
jgi:hypothetical protein